MIAHAHINHLSYQPCTFARDYPELEFVHFLTPPGILVSQQLFNFMALGQGLQYFLWCPYTLSMPLCLLMSHIMAPICPRHD